ncbi:hypothetical protein DPMN_000626 [Dreissena polymorpha]|uniref:Uncharacterized protein n=1 Tax=Dreissena polymorpha TaxID=45954 RepID=A0A9D4MJX9_DREPO|nr:hypothetical protein DPMN_000626 [Dreissena polymorpha]
MRHWNILSPDVTNSNALLEFKRKITQCPTNSCPLFNVGDRRLQIYHSRLRLGCSSLNYDLHRRNMTSSPDCICGAIETPSHSLIHCPRYQHTRQHCFTNLPGATTVNNAEWVKFPPGTTSLYPGYLEVYFQVPGVRGSILQSTRGTGK